MPSVLLLFIQYVSSPLLLSPLHHPQEKKKSELLISMQNYPPVALDQSIVKRMVQMGYTSKEVQAVVLNNETSPILTTYHAIRNLSLENVPDFHLHDGSMVISAAPRHPTTLPPQPTTSPPRARASSNALSVSPESPRLDVDSTTPPLLAIACEMPENPTELSSSSSPVISAFDDLLATPAFEFADADADNAQSEYRAVPQESDYYRSSTPPLATSLSLPGLRIPPPSSSSPLPSPTYRPRGESDPPSHISSVDEFEPGLAAPHYSLSTPSSPQKDDPSILPNLLRSPSPTSSPSDEGRARALSASDVGTWSDDYAHEQTNPEDQNKWNVMKTLEDQNGISLPLPSLPLPLPPSLLSLLSLLICLLIFF